MLPLQIAKLFAALLRCLEEVASIKDDFDWIAYQEKTFKQKLMRKGQTLVPCFEHFLYKQHP